MSPLSSAGPAEVGRKEGDIRQGRKMFSLIWMTSFMILCFKSTNSVTQFSEKGVSKDYMNNVNNLRKKGFRQSYASHFQSYSNRVDLSATDRT